MFDSNKSVDTDFFDDTVEAFDLSGGELDRNLQNVHEIPVEKKDIPVVHSRGTDNKGFFFKMSGDVYKDLRFVSLLRNSSVTSVLNQIISEFLKKELKSLSPEELSFRDFYRKRFND